MFSVFSFPTALPKFQELVFVLEIHSVLEERFLADKWLPAILTVSAAL